MLRREQVEHVQQLLATNVSQREISRLTGVSRDSVRRIFKGQWHFSPLREQTLHTHRGRVGRCRECGALVLLPCLACLVRRPRPAGQHAVQHVA